MYYYHIYTNKPKMCQSGILSSILHTFSESFILMGLADKTIWMFLETIPIQQRGNMTDTKETLSDDE